MAKHKKRGPTTRPISGLVDEGYDLSYRGISTRIYWIRWVCNGLLQEQFAARLGKSQSTVAGWENQKARDAIGLKAAIRVCEEFGVTLDFIYRGDPTGIDDEEKVKSYTEHLKSNS